MSDLLSRISDAVRWGRKDEIEKLAEEVIANNIDPIEVIQKGGVAGLDSLGQAFEELEAFLPELMMGGETMKILIDKLSPHMENQKSAFAGKVVIGTVKGDLHDIGKNLVATTLSVNGFNVVDLGVDVSTNKFIELATQNDADIIAMSSLLTTSAYYMEELVTRLVKEDMRSKFKVIVGGGPIDPNWAKTIGADAYARTAVGAVKTCKELMKIEKISETLIGD
ncbi:MAG: corrinoid protein [Clostridia bacterium]|nr:corrinoid protein [Clostridia bacterium]